MKVSFILALCCCCCVIATAQIREQQITVKYDWNEITCSQKQNLEQFIAGIGTDAIRSITMQIPADANAGAANQSLYTARLQRMKTYLCSLDPKAAANWFSTEYKPDNVAPNVRSIQQQPANTLILTIQYENLVAYDDLEQRKQHFRYHTAYDINITGEQNTLIAIAPFSFQTKSGTVVNDFIEITLIEIYSQADMALYHVTTSSHGQLLESGGMVQLKAYWNKEEIYLIPGVNYIIKLPTKQQVPGMQLFYGAKTNNQIDWTATGQTPQADLFDIESSEVNYMQAEGGEKMYETEYSTANYYVFAAAKLNWINCDHFYDAPYKTNVQVLVPKTPNMTVMLIYKNIKSVVEASQTGSTYSFENVPVGEAVSIVAISGSKKNIQYGVVDLNVRDDKPIAMDLSGSGLDNLKNYLKAYSN